MTDDKKTLRRAFLQQRQGLSPDRWQTQSAQLVQHLQAAPLLAQATTVLAYFSVRQEPDLSPLFAFDKVWAFPRCVQVGDDRALQWHRWSPGQPLSTGPYGIPEPMADAPSITAADLILVPAVACDRQGYRLGYGGGFYDRLLSQSPWATTPTIGITFAAAHVDTLPHDPWDRPLTVVCTELGLGSAIDNSLPRFPQNHAGMP
jgi:5-formyltetrahydrofolate cyclo-ligase